MEKITSVAWIGRSVKGKQILEVGKDQNLELCYLYATEGVLEKDWEPKDRPPRKVTITIEIEDPKPQRKEDIRDRDRYVESTNKKTVSCGVNVEYDEKHGLILTP